MNIMIILTAITAVVSYLIGSVNFSILISKTISGKDIRESGSGNAGATNMLRAYGKGWAALTLVLDIAKGVLPVLLTILYARYINAPERYYEWGSQSDLAMHRSDMIDASLPYIAALFVLLGHCFPVFFGFRGGKGVATALGVVMMLDWKIGLIVLVIALAVMAISRYVSLGSIIAAALFFVLILAQMMFEGNWNIVKLACAALIALLIIGRHHANISRLMRGEENKLSFKKKME